MLAHRSTPRQDGEGMGCRVIDKLIQIQVIEQGQWVLVDYENGSGYFERSAMPVESWIQHMEHWFVVR